jgi:hypothetical protein
MLVHASVCMPLCACACTHTWVCVCVCVCLCVCVGKYVCMHIYARVDGGSHGRCMVVLGQHAMQSFPLQVDLRTLEKELFRPAAVSTWFTADCKLGSLCVHLETPTCFTAEIYAMDLDRMDVRPLSISELTSLSIATPEEQTVCGCIVILQCRGWYVVPEVSYVLRKGLRVIVTQHIQTCEGVLCFLTGT